VRTQGEMSTEWPARVELRAAEVTDSATPDRASTACDVAIVLDPKLSGQGDNLMGSFPPSTLSTRRPEPASGV
jgi:hypothetical protein